LCITMWTEALAEAKRRTTARACVKLRAFSPAAPHGRRDHSPPPPWYIVAVTRLRPEFLLR
jgi:hypothetical protein